MEIVKLKLFILAIVMASVFSPVFASSSVTPISISNGRVIISSVVSEQCSCDDADACCAVCSANPQDYVACTICGDGGCVVPPQSKHKF